MNEQLNQHLCAALEKCRQLSEGHTWVSSHPVQPIIDEIDNYPETVSYDYVAASVRETSEQVAQNYGLDHCRLYHSVLIVKLIERSLPRLDHLALPASVKQKCEQNFSRIIDGILADDTAYMSYDQDRFHKDLSAAHLRLICVGVLKLGRVGFPLGLVKSAPLKCLTLAFKVGSKSIFYEGHTDASDPNLMAEFNEAGWIDFFLRCAELLALNKEVGGVICASWFFAPEVALVSPRLAYLRRLALENGGIDFYQGSNDGDIESATRTSKTRRDKYNSGEYLPTKYKMVWPRKALMAWAKRQLKVPE